MSTSGTCFSFDTKMTISLWQSLTAGFAAGLHHLWPMGMIIFQWKPFGTKRHVEILCLCCAFISLSQNVRRWLLEGSTSCLWTVLGQESHRDDGGPRNCEFRHAAGLILNWCQKSTLKSPQELQICRGAQRLLRNFALLSFSLKNCLSISSRPAASCGLKPWGVPLADGALHSSTLAQNLERLGKVLRCTGCSVTWSRD